MRKATDDIINSVIYFNMRSVISVQEERTQNRTCYITSNICFTNASSAWLHPVMFANSQQIKFYGYGHTVNSIFIANAFVLVESQYLALYLTHILCMRKIRLKVKRTKKCSEQCLSVFYLSILSLSACLYIFVSKHSSLCASILLLTYFSTLLPTYLPTNLPI